MVSEAGFGVVINLALPTSDNALANAAVLIGNFQHRVKKEGQDVQGGQQLFRPRLTGVCRKEKKNSWDLKIPFYTGPVSREEKLSVGASLKQGSNGTVQFWAAYS